MPGPSSPKRGRRRRRSKSDRPPKPGADAASVISRPRELDFERPTSEPLSKDEVREMREHLVFLRRYKTMLRLKLNAAEDLLINGAREPTDRGVCQHLLSKVDNASVQRALIRDPLKSRADQRALFLAGVVRIDPDLTRLLEYLDTVALVAERADAARAFAHAVDRLDFGALSDAQVIKLLEVVEHTFAGHDRTQALFGLLSSGSFRAALERLRPRISEALQAPFSALAAVHAVVVLGEAPPTEEEDGNLLAEGVTTLLAAPARALRGYPAEMRARLAELAMRTAPDDADARDAARRLLDSLPEQDDSYIELRCARADQLLRAGEVDAARALINKIASAHPDLRWARPRQEALGWRKVGGVMASGRADDGDLHKGYWLAGPCPAWVRTGPPSEAGRFVAEGRLQATTAVPGIAPVLGHGLADDGRVYLAVPALGRGLPKGPYRMAAPDAILFALDGAQLLAALARAGVEVPDADRARFRWIAGSPSRLVLASFAGVKRAEPGAAAIAHGAIARAWIDDVLADRSDLPEVLAEKLQAPAPLPVLVDALAIGWATVAA